MPLRLALVSVLLLSGLFSFSRDDEKIVAHLTNRGRNIMLFHPDSALRLYDSAYRIGLRAKNVYWMGSSLFGMGNCQWFMGRTNHAVDTIRLAISFLRKVNSRPAKYDWFSALRVLGNVYDGMGDYGNAFIATSEALAHYKDFNDTQNTILCLVQMGSLYRNIGEFNTALGLYRQAEAKEPEPGEYDYRELYHQKGRLYAERGMLDSALICYEKALPGHPVPRVIHLRMAEVFLLQNRLREAKLYFEEVVSQAPMMAEAHVLVPGMLGMARIYLKENNIDSALSVSQRALSIAEFKKARQLKRDASFLLYDVYLRLKDSSHALRYYKQYVELKDSVISEKFKGQLFAFKQKSEEERHASQLRLLRWSIYGLVVLSAFGIFVLLLRNNNEKLKMRQRASELEMQALRAQMNPHFIFNCLSSINHFILDKDTDNASKYLTRFSRLIRRVLSNSAKDMISLEEELDMLKLYLDMERLRFTDAFEYHIAYDPSIQPSVVMIPSFILQPFCENAIWHGLLHKDGKRELRIDLHLQKDMLICIISDNGVGRKKAAALQERQTEKTGSFGHRLTTERIALFNQTVRASESFVIEDIKDKNGDIAGTQVTIRIKSKTQHD